MPKAIPYPYGSATDRTLLDKIESEREKQKTVEGFLPEYWLSGCTICTRNNRGVYHVYVPEKSPFDGKILRDYRINKYGHMVDTNLFYKVSTKQDMLSWCEERGITLE